MNQIVNLPLTLTLAAMTWLGAAVSIQPEGTEPAPITISADPLPLPEPTARRDSGRYITISGADYVRIEPEPVSIIAGVPIPVASMISAFGEQTDIVVEVVLDVDYVIHAAAISRDPDDGAADATTTHTTIDMPATRSHKIQAMIQHQFDLIVRQEDLGEITFFEYVDAMARMNIVPGEPEDGEQDGQ